MANLNVNIANKLLSYVRHGVDVSEEIARVYKNSMIFIGDEQQIYVPAMQAYVGIGMTAYNNTIDRIAGVEEQMAELANRLTTDMVSKIYANYSLDEANGANGIQDGAQTKTTITDKIWALNNEITIKGVNDYDPATGFARKNETDHHYQIQTAIPDGANNPLTVDVVNSNFYRSETESTSIPTSGIRVTPHWGTITRVENPITYQSIEKRIGNYIEIDDSLTWSYMTSAYAYTLSFARNFTNAEIDKVYHDLLGDSNYVYNPELYTSVLADVTDEINKLSASDRAKVIYDANADDPEHGNYIEPGKRLVYTGTAYYIVDVSRTFFYASYTSGSDVLNGTKDYHQLTESQLLKLAQGITLADGEALTTPFVNYTSGTDSDRTNFPQLYTRSIEYGSTYNMNIADGIQTLKEVAYLLDLLSDGSLGSVTYLTYAEFNTNTNNGTTDLDAYHIINVKENPANNEIYCYFVKTGDPENLGINIAYSIAGNKVQIDDLHAHTTLVEQGKTSLRSVQSTSSNYVNLDIEGGKYSWTNTDVNEGNLGTEEAPSWKPNHPNSNVKNSYVVGDVNLKVNVQTGITYTTIYNASGAANYNPKFIDEFGILWYGQYTAADMKNLKPGVEYYQISTTQGTSDNPVMELVNEPVLDYHAQANDVQYYWIPLAAELGSEYNVNNYVGPDKNAVYTKITVANLIGLEATENLPKTTKKKTEVDTFYVRNTDGSWTPIISENGVTAAEKIENNPDGVVDALGKKQNAVYYISDYDNVVLHAWVPGNEAAPSDALATTDWTYAFVSSKLQDIANDLEDILTQANQYTDDRIAELDNEYKYSDFEAYWTSYVDYWSSNNAPTPDPSIAIAGSATYNTAYEREYQLFKDRGVDETYIGLIDPATGNLVYSDTQYRLSYQTNSRYSYNIIEIDGIVYADTRELPTDKLTAEVEIWGSDENLPSNKFEYAPVVITESLASTDSTFIESLFNWAATGVTPAGINPDSTDTTSDNQVFVKIENVVCEKVPTTEATPWVGNSLMYYDEGSDTYFGYPAQDNAIPVMRDYRDTLDKKWVQLYKYAPKYFELDLTKAIPDTDDPLHAVIVDGYRLTRSGNNIAVSGDDGKYGTADTVLYYISLRPTNKAKYLTVENKHHSFEHNGFGENTLGLTAHITKLEDARIDNTGFADAYDVQSYIEDTLTWVDVSASVPENLVATSEKYYRHITYDVWANGTANVDYMTTDGSLYYVKNGTFTEYTGSEPATAIFWADDNKFFSLTDMPTPTQATNMGHVAIQINNVPVLAIKRFNVTGINTDQSTQPNAADVKYSAASDYYVQIESAKINPRNLTITQYGRD